MGQNVLDNQNDSGWDQKNQYRNLDKYYMGCLILTFAFWYLIQNYYFEEYLLFLENWWFDRDGLVNLSQAGTIYLIPCLMMSAFVIISSVPVLKQYYSTQLVIITLFILPAIGILLLIPSYGLAWSLNRLGMFSNAVVLSLNFTLIALLGFRLLHYFARLQIDHELKAQYIKETEY